MQLGNRLFPYPVLNNSKGLSEFKEDVTFELKIKLNENGEIIKTRNKIILKDVYFVLTDEDLMKLYTEGKIECFLIVESPSSIYRQKYILSDVPQTYEIPIGNLKDDVFISAYCIAKCDIDDYKSRSFDEDFKDYSFNIKKYDIVAADDGMKFVIDRDLDEDNKVSSIFVMIMSNADKNSISYDMKADRIYIYMPPKEFKKYNTIKKDSRWNDIFYALIAIPVLTGCFADLKKDFSDLSDLQIIVEQYRWMKSVIKSYKKETGVELTNEEFMNINPLNLAQVVFNYSSVHGITEFCDFIINGVNNEDE